MFQSNHPNGTRQRGYWEQEFRGMVAELTKDELAALRALLSDLQQNPEHVDDLPETDSLQD